MMLLLLMFVLLLFFYFSLETEKCYDIVLNICFPFFVLYFSEQKPETQEKTDGIYQKKD
jgi:hypothetical protein